MADQESETKPSAALPTAAGKAPVISADGGKGNRKGEKPPGACVEGADLNNNVVLDAHITHNTHRQSSNGHDRSTCSSMHSYVKVYCPLCTWNAVQTMLTLPSVKGFVLPPTVLLAASTVCVVCATVPPIKERYVVHFVVEDYTCSVYSSVQQDQPGSHRRG